MLPSQGQSARRSPTLRRARPQHSGVARAAGAATAFNGWRTAQARDPGRPQPRGVGRVGPRQTQTRPPQPQGVGRVGPRQTQTRPRVALRGGS